MRISAAKRVVSSDAAIHAFVVEGTVIGGVFGSFSLTTGALGVVLSAGVYAGGGIGGSCVTSSGLEIAAPRRESLSCLRIVSRRGFPGVLQHG